MCVVGLGHVGRAVARLCKALGLSVVGARVNPRPTECVDRVYGADRLREALAGADYAVVCTPKTRRTAGLIDAGALAAMKPGACLIDVSRGGGVTVADDLIAALRSGHLGGASLDVFDPEPMPADCPLWDMENVLVTPHASATFEGWELRGVEIFAGNLGRRMAGRAAVQRGRPRRAATEAGAAAPSRLAGTARGGGQTPRGIDEDVAGHRGVVDADTLADDAERGPGRPA